MKILADPTGTKSARFTILMHQCIILSHTHRNAEKWEIKKINYVKD
jgi:hypothetical protein